MIRVKCGTGAEWNLSGRCSQDPRVSSAFIATGLSQLVSEVD